MRFVLLALRVSLILSRRHEAGASSRWIMFAGTICVFKLDLLTPNLLGKVNNSRIELTKWNLQTQLREEV